MSRYKLVPEVRGDLMEIYRYIARNNPVAAGRLRDLFYDKFEFLAKHARIGQMRDDLAEGVRAFPVGNYVILFRAVEDGIEIIQVVHGARDINAIFRGRS
jgi:toxin ParE1/3/4